MNSHRQRTFILRVTFNKRFSCPAVLACRLLSLTIGVSSADDDVRAVSATRVEVEAQSDNEERHWITAIAKEEK